MQLLALDTSTETLSVAVCTAAGDPGRVWRFDGVGGAQASATLLPLVLDLMAQARVGFATLDAIVFGRGPGAFTGLRTACAVAQGLAFGAAAARGGRPLAVLPVDSLLAVAEDARWRHAPDAEALRVTALLDARMDQVYAATYAYAAGQWQTLMAPLLDAPEALPAQRGGVLAGNAFGLYGERLAHIGETARVPALPTAEALLRVAPALLAAGLAVPADQALPLYIRDKVAQTTAERAALRAGAAS